MLPVCDGLDILHACEGVCIPDMYSQPCEICTNLIGIPAALDTLIPISPTHLRSCMMLQELGYPWVMRKAMIKYGSKSTDIIKTKGATMKIVTVNAKGSWTRLLDTDRPVHQVPGPLIGHVKNVLGDDACSADLFMLYHGVLSTSAERTKGLLCLQGNAMGLLCKVSSFWDGAIHKSQFEPADPSLKPRLESWRYMDGGMMVSPHTIMSSRGQSGWLPGMLALYLLLPPLHNG